MRLLAPLLIVLVVLACGCVTPEPENKTNYTVVEPVVVGDTTLNAPVISPQVANAQATDVVLQFDENVVIKSFLFDGAAKSLSTDDHMRFNYTAAKLTEGVHRVTVTASDIAGNSVTAEANVTVDTAKPRLTSIVPGEYEVLSKSETDVKLVFSEEVTITSSQLDSTLITLSTENNKEFTGFLDGLEYGKSYTIRVTVEDKAGNSLTIASPFSLRDIYAPSQVDGLMANATGESGELLLTWKASEEADFAKYNIYISDNGPFSSVSAMEPKGGTSPASKNEYLWQNLADDKQYCFAVTAVDGEGNENAVVKSSCGKPSTIDTKPPVITSYYPDTVWTTSSSPSLEITTNEAATCKYSIDTSGGWDAQTYSQMNYTFTKDSEKKEHTGSVSMANGMHNIFVLCRDEVGNTMSSVDSWSVDVNFSP
jgi:hypothetical protein